MTHTAHSAPDAGATSPKPPGRRARSLLVERLRARIAGLEAAPGLIAPADRSTPVTGPAWNLGLAAVDRHLPHLGLAANGVHEIAAAAYGDMPAALGFAAALSVRRLGACADERPVLWCRLSAGAREWGRLYGHGLEALGLARRRLLTVTLNRQDAILWTLEEALKSTGLAGVIADVGPGLDLTAVRRLMLAASRGGTPALLLFPSPPQGGTAARTRWIVAAQASLPPPFDEKAPGAPAWDLRLVRCRGGRPGQWYVEWSHATHRFALASAISGRTADPRQASDAEHPSASGAGAGGRPRLAGLGL